MNNSADASDHDVIRDHRRQWRHCLYVYPVISRRSGGMSIGVNLNPDKRCNFACIYCQVNRRIKRNPYEVDLDVLRRELGLALSEAASGNIWLEDRFANTPAELRRINDIAFSGDGEPTCLPNFDGAVAVAADVKRQAGLPEVKLVVITNATQLDSPQVTRALATLDANAGEIWAKLDAGTDEQFQLINRPHPRINIEQVVSNITSVAQGRPVAIQTLLMRIDGKGPTAAELDAYCDRIREILDAGGHISALQVHTIARSPESPRVATLSDAELDAAVKHICEALSDVTVETYYGHDVPPQQR